MVASALKNPRVQVNVTHGILDAELALPGIQFVDVTIPVKGISVKDVLKLAGVRRTVEQFLPLLDAVRFLNVSGIDDNGKLVFASEATQEMDHGPGSR